jgi:FkbM family methyltransferase
MGRTLWSLRMLCPSARAKVRLAFVYLMMFFTAVLRRPSHTHRLRLTLGGIERDWYVGDVTELGALWEVFLAEQYGEYLPDRADLIVDAGANTGAATAWLRGHYPSALIIAVEPDPDAAARLRLNLLQDANVTIVEAAMSDVAGTVRFRAEGLSMNRQVIHDGDSKTIEVPAVTLESLIERSAPGRAVDLLKIDTEGSEWCILKGSLGEVKAVVLEIHSPVPGGGCPDDALDDVARRDGFVVRSGRWPDVRWLLPTPE